MRRKQLCHELTYIYPIESVRAIVRSYFMLTSDNINCSRKAVPAYTANSIKVIFPKAHTMSPQGMTAYYIATRKWVICDYLLLNCITVKNMKFHIRR